MGVFFLLTGLCSWVLPSLPMAKNYHLLISFSITMHHYWDFNCLYFAEKIETNLYTILLKILFCFWNNLLIMENYTLNKFNYKLL